MTPEDTIREKSALLADWADGAHPVTVDDVRADLIGALDALVAERDALAARLAEAERQRDEFKKTAFDMHDFGSEWKVRAREAEARVAALTAAVVAECVDDLSVPCDCDEDAICLAHRVLAAADRPEGTTP